MAVRQLIYFSTAASAIGQSDIDAILTASWRDNAEAGITGLLLFMNGVFAQVLEGDPAVVEALYARILADPRHRDAEVLSDKTITVRSFDDWSMAYIETTAHELARAAGLDVLLRDPSLLPTLEDDPAMMEGGIARALQRYADQLTRAGEDAPRGV